MSVTNFQSESKRVGDIFEDLVLEDLGRLFSGDITRHVVLEDIGVEADFAYTLRGSQVYVEAKGGQRGHNKRPGAKRTDNVKKAIANGALIKAAYENATYIVYFSELPKFGSSSHKMIKSAIVAGYIDSVRYLIDM